ncbi:MAG: 2-oxoglutarate dehydrogenase E1 component [Cytophagales bacterium]
MDKFSYLSNAHTDYIDALYDSYKKDPNSVDITWQKFFEGFDFSQAKYGENAGYTKSATGSPSIITAVSEKEIQVRNLIYEYRRRGHLKSKTNPVRERKDRKPRLDLSNFGLSDADLDTVFVAGREIGLENASLRQIVDKLEKIYCRSLGYEFMYVRKPEHLDWLRDKIEAEGYNITLNSEEKKMILRKLNEAVVFENFLHTKYVGQKRFSLEGGENTIPGLEMIIEKAAELGAEEVVIGMAHRGRLNVLCNIMGKTYEQIFTEFEGNSTPDMTMGDGDVKYHMGYASEITTASGNKMNLKLAPNPSHLEAVDPVVLGYSRSQIDDEFEGDATKVVPILIHGDAAVAGQGIVYEIAQMARLKAYHTGGTIHFVINNQVGFTTDFEDARSSIYCTDVAKVIDAPVIHVNGDDAEAVAFACKLAIEFRQKFGNDFFVDMVCYRRHGHNESDEPKFTQPVLYNIIAKHPNPREVYNKTLIERGDVDAAMAQKLDKEFRDLLQDRLNLVKQNPLPYTPQKLEREWDHLRRSKPEDFVTSPETGVEMVILEKVGKSLLEIPKNFKPIKQIENLLKDRKKMLVEDKSINWATAELLAYGSLLLEGKFVRMSGQDVQRGTFSHRHAVVKDMETNEPYNFLNNIEEGQGKFEIYNSLLSEYGVLGFEYGYAMANPNALVVWEAQFGDFANGAQTMIDQFISGGESKWQRMNGIVLLLPHGYEGQGPEHSNARPERFLQLAAEYNMVVANCTTPANFFHLLRRQLAWPFRKPCVVMTPKSLLRNPLVVSPLQDLATGGKFQEVIDDLSVNPADVKKVLFCTGKVYYDLLAEKQKSNRNDVAIVRFEQMAPFPLEQADAIVAKYNNASFTWVQEEPGNMGGWSYIHRVYSKMNLSVVARKYSASTAVGYSKIHEAEQKDIVKRAFE